MNISTRKFYYKKIRKRRCPPKVWVLNSLVVVKVVNNSQLKNSPEFREAKRKIVRVIGEAMLSKDTQYGYDEELHKKYDLPKRLERNRVRDQEIV